MSEEDLHRFVGVVEPHFSRGIAAGLEYFELLGGKVDIQINLFAINTSPMSQNLDLEIPVSASLLFEVKWLF
jgi:hypothetical protein